MEKFKIAMLLFPDVTILDFTGPYDVFIRTDNFEVLVVSETTEPFKAEGGMFLKADFSLTDCPQADIIFAPGGRGINALLTSDAYLNFLKIQSQQARYITSVCTGSLLLAAAGLLNGYRATTHWRSLDLLNMFDVDVVDERVVIDRNRITGGGVTAGIDFGLKLTAMLCGDEHAQTAQLMLNYMPEPPFQSGSPKTASVNVLNNAMHRSEALYDLRKRIIEDLIKK